MVQKVRQSTSRPAAGGGALEKRILHIVFVRYAALVYKVVGLGGISRFCAMLICRGSLSPFFFLLESAGTLFAFETFWAFVCAWTRIALCKSFLFLFFFSLRSGLTVYPPGYE